MRKTFSLFAALMVSGALAAGCSGSGSGSAKSGTGTSSKGATTTTKSNGAPVTTISAQGFKFMPANANVVVGQEITFDNQDNARHSITADDGSFQTETVKKAKSTFTVTKAGSYPFHCSVHSYMTGTITAAAK